MIYIHDFNISFYKVLDPETGWVKIRPYCQETWSFLRARFKCPLLLMSATMEENSLQRICGNFWLGIIMIINLKYFQTILTYQEMSLKFCTSHLTEQISTSNVEFVPNPLMSGLYHKTTNSWTKLWFAVMFILTWFSSFLPLSTAGLSNVKFFALQEIWRT